MWVRFNFKKIKSPWEWVFFGAIALFLVIELLTILALLFVGGGPVANFMSRVADIAYAVATVIATLNFFVRLYAELKNKEKRIAAKVNALLPALFLTLLLWFLLFNGNFA